jgi:ADP-heptose:LPS heptosyltransferase
MPDTPSQKLEYWWRHAIVYPVLHILLHNPPIKLPIDIKSVTRILIFRYDRIGDMIVTTPIFRLLKQANPNLQIGVLASETNAELIRNNPNVDEIYVLYRNFSRRLKELLRIRAQRYDMTLHFVFNRTTRGALLAKFIAPHSIKIGQGDVKYGFYFNALLAPPRFREHMVHTLAFMVEKVFGIKNSLNDFDFEITLDSASLQKITDFSERHYLALRGEGNSHNIPYIVFNLSATDAARRISVTQAIALIQHLKDDSRFKLILSASPTDNEMQALCKRLTATGKCLSFPDEGSASLLELAALIQYAAAVVTPDTSIIHFASAMKTPVLGFFTPRQGMNEWLPYNVPHKLVTAEEGKDVSTIPISQMKDAADEFLDDCFSHH